MKILVPVKRVVDANVKVRVKADGSAVELANVKMAMNPFDEIAVEEAIRLKEAGKAEEIIVVSIGPQQAQETLRTALAMGADRAILVKTDEQTEPLGVAKVLKGVVEAEQHGMLALGAVKRMHGTQRVHASNGTPAGHPKLGDCGRVRPRRRAAGAPADGLRRGGARAARRSRPRRG